MYALPHQVEYLSDGWLGATERYLQRELAAGRLAPVGPFAVCQRTTDAPPHLGFAGGKTAWNVRFDGERLTVERADDPDADLVIEGDYQAFVTFAQRVGFASAAVRRAAEDEVAHLYGKDAIRVRGQAHPALEALLAGLHDHLGRRTVENPDLAHRARRQGLAGHVADLEANGFTVLKRAITDDVADEIRQTTVRVLADHGVSSLNWMLYQGGCFELLAQQPTLMTLVDASLGRGAVIGSFSAIQRGPGPGTIPLHTDYAHVPEPYPEWAVTGVGVWAFEDWTEASGPTWVMPGSHRRRRPPRRGEEPEGGVAVEMPKGSVVFFTDGLWHWQGDRTQPDDRITLHWHFNRGIFRSLEPKKVDPQMLHRNAPRLGEMLGEDDWFDKMHGIGRDHTRFAHMQRLHRFTERQKAALLTPDR